MIQNSAYTIIANWKMNGSWKTLCEFIDNIDPHFSNWILCPSAPYIQMLDSRFPKLRLGAQDCALNDKGAFTGDISALQLKDVGASFVILGHSERIKYHQESTKETGQKVQKALEAGLTPVICVGESLEMFQTGKTVETVLSMLEEIFSEVSLQDNPSGETPVCEQNFMIAYEPVWAIGSGLVPSLENIQKVHDEIAKAFPQKDILYGGSVSKENAASILAIPSVKGLLVGNASLNSQTFNCILTSSHRGDL